MSGEALDTSIDASLFPLKDSPDTDPNDSESWGLPLDSDGVPITDYEPIIVEYVHTGDEELGFVPYLRLGEYTMSNTVRNEFMEFFFQAANVLDERCKPIKKGTRKSGDPEQGEKS